MKSFTYTITDAIGIHARPAGLLVNTAKQFESEILIEANGKKGNAKGIMGVMSLGAKQGTEITVTANGADEEAAANALEEFLKNNL